MWLLGLGMDADWAAEPRSARLLDSGWEEVPVPRAGGGTVLRAMAVGGPARLVAAGRVERASAERPVVERWNGRAWVVDASTPSVGAGATMTDIAAWGTARAWAVGYTQQPSGSTRAVAVRWASGAWTSLSPRVAGESALLGVAGVSGHDLWTVGWTRAASAAFRPLVLHRSAGGWQRARISRTSTAEAVLTSVAMRSAADGWAVGSRRRRGGWVPFVLRWDGRAWTEHEAPSAPDGASTTLLRDVAIRPTDIVAAGTAWDPSLHGTRSFLARWDGSAWHRAVDLAGIARADLRTIAVDGTGTWLGGKAGNTGLILHSCSGSGAASLRAYGLGPDPRAVSRRGGGRRSGPEDERVPNVTPIDVGGRPATLADPVAPTTFSVRDVANEVGLGLAPNTYGAVVTDLDVDGWPDLAIGRHGAPLLLLRNRDGAGFDAVGEPFPAIDRHGCDAGDVDGDGLPDLVCAVGAAHGLGLKSNELWLSPASPDRRDAVSAWGIEDTFGRGRRMALFDADRDGRLDLFVANEPIRPDGLPSPDHLYLDVDGARFRREPSAGLDLPIGGVCVRPADVDRDGWTDLVVCGDGHVHLFRNRGGRFTDVTTSRGIVPLGEVDAAVADMNGDGRPDLVQLSRVRLRVALQRADGTFRKGLEVAITGGQALAVGDVDADGHRDLYVLRTTPKKNLRDLLLLGAGDGRAFTSVAIPQVAADQGAGESVVALDHDRNGHTDFLVLNGRSSRHGPIELLAFGPPEPDAAPGADPGG
jgi:hypothetical protein